MEIWGPKLPKGWRYPAGRRALRAALGDLPGIRVLLDQRWAKSYRSAKDRSLPVVAEAGLSAAFTGDDFPSVTVYGWRKEEYPDSASLEFVESVLPRMHTFLEEQLNLERSSVIHTYVRLRVLWQGDEHEFVYLQGGTVVP